jgi:hypothetical protein
MGKLTGLARLVAIIGAGVLIPAGFGYAQVDGAVQYPPASVGKDAQPPPPAGMVPQSVSPRRIEQGGSGSSQSPAGFASSSRLWPDTGRHPPSLGSSSEPISSAGRN